MLTSDNKTLYISARDDGGKIYVYDIETKKIIKEIPITPVNKLPHTWIVGPYIYSYHKN
jgi:uncharacterized FlaG/YvyC family protein